MRCYLECSFCFLHSSTLTTFVTLLLHRLISNLSSDHHHHRLSYSRADRTWAFLIIRPYHPSLLAGSLGCIQCLSKADGLILASRWTLACPYIGFHLGTSLMSSSLFLQQCPACLVRHISMVCETGGKWPYSCSFYSVRSVTYRIYSKPIVAFLCSFPYSFLSMHFVSVQVVHPRSSTHISSAWKKYRFISLERSDFHWMENLHIEVYAFAQWVMRSYPTERLFYKVRINWKSTRKDVWPCFNFFLNLEKQFFNY